MIASAPTKAPGRDSREPPAADPWDRVPPLFASTCNRSGVYLTNHKYTWLHPRPALVLQRELHNKAPRSKVDDAQYRHYRDWFEDGKDRHRTEE